MHTKDKYTISTLQIDTDVQIGHVRRKMGPEMAVYPILVVLYRNT